MLIFLAILEGNAGDHVALIKGLAFSILIAYGAFFLTWLTIDAVLPVIVLGTTIFGFGGLILTIAVVVFFITGSLFTRLNEDHTKTENVTGHEIRRDGMQVWANGFWIAFFCILWFLTDIQLLLGAAFAVVAVATADTWATEVGIRNPGRTIDLRSRNSVAPGSDGGVSLKGTLFSFLGALLIGFFASQAIAGSTLWILFSVTIGGFLGCFIDSYIGARYQGDQKNVPPGSIWSKLDNEKQNSLVNWLSTGSGGIITLLLLLIL